MRCSMMMIVLSSFAMSSMSSMATFPVFGSRLARGSSKSRMSTSSTMTPARDTLCFCPPESAWGLFSIRESISTIFAISMTFFFISSCGTMSFSSAKAMSSPTLRPMNWPSESCNTVPTLCDNSKREDSFVSIPATFKDPFIFPLWEKGIRPLIQLPRVLFPQPLGPAIRIFSPLCIVRSISWSVSSLCSKYWKQKSLKRMISSFIAFLQKKKEECFIPLSF